MFKSNLEIIFRKEVLTPPSPESVSPFWALAHVTFKDAGLFWLNMWTVMQIINREPNFFSGLTVWGKEQKMHPFKNSALIWFGV